MEREESLSLYQVTEGVTDCPSQRAVCTVTDGKSVLPNNSKDAASSADHSRSDGTRHHRLAEGLQHLAADIK